MLDFADFVAINKFDRKGADDALRDVRKQLQRNREAFREPAEAMPVFGTIAARFNDDGVTALYHALADSWPQKGLAARSPAPAEAGGDGVLEQCTSSSRPSASATSPRSPRRVRGYHAHAERQARARARAPAAARDADDARHGRSPASSTALIDREGSRSSSRRGQDAARHAGRQTRRRRYAGDEQVGEGARQGDAHAAHAAPRSPAPRCRRSRCRATRTTASSCAGACARTCRASSRSPRGVFPFKREDEDPTRMFAGEGDAVPHQQALPPALARTCRRSACRPRSTR